MKVTLTSTTKVVTLMVKGADVPARIWEGETESGIPVHAYITRVGVANEFDAKRFKREVRQCSAPSVPTSAMLRLVL